MLAHAFKFVESVVCWSGKIIFDRRSPPKKLAHQKRTVMKAYRSGPVSLSIRYVIKSRIRLRVKGNICDSRLASIHSLVSDTFSVRRISAQSREGIKQDRQQEQIAEARSMENDSASPHHGSGNIDPKTPIGIRNLANARAKMTPAKNIGPSAKRQGTA